MRRPSAPPPGARLFDTIAENPWFFAEMTNSRVLELKGVEIPQWFEPDQRQRPGGRLHLIGGGDIVLDQHGDAMERTPRRSLRELGIEAWSFTVEVGGVAVDPANATRSREDADASPLRCPDPDAEARMIARIDEARSAGESCGTGLATLFEVIPT